MSRNSRPKREDKRTRQFDSANDGKIISMEDFVKEDRSAIKPLNERQEMHKAALFNDEFVVSIGAAGTGKTFLSASVAAEIYRQNGCKKLILTRPNVDVGESFGYLPGELEEKYAPYLEPFQDALVQRLGSGKFTCDMNKKILPKPLQFMRGKTFDDSIMLLDEAQNTTVAEMKMFVTRIGINTRVFISGDTKQCDLKLRTGEKNGLEWLVDVLRKNESVHTIIDYQKEDCVRSGLAREFLGYIESDY